VKRTFSREYKLSIVKEMLRGEQTVAQICRDNNVGQNVVRRWKREYDEQGETAWQSSPPAGDVVWTGPTTTATPTSSPGSTSADERRLIQQQQARIAALESALGRSHLECEFLREVLSKKGSLLVKR
jgi:transposase-like protein